MLVKIQSVDFPSSVQRSKKIPLLGTSHAGRYIAWELFLPYYLLNKPSPGSFMTKSQIDYEFYCKKIKFSTHTKVGVFGANDLVRVIK